MSTDVRNYWISKGGKIHRDGADCFGARYIWIPGTVSNERPCRNCLPNGLAVRVA